jgi:hypothetical protein
MSAVRFNAPRGGVKVIRFVLFQQTNAPVPVTFVT